MESAAAVDAELLPALWLCDAEAAGGWHVRWATTGDAALVARLANQARATGTECPWTRASAAELIATHPELAIVYRGACAVGFCGVAASGRAGTDPMEIRLAWSLVDGLDEREAETAAYRLFAVLLDGSRLG